MTIGFLKRYPLAGAHLMGSYHRVVINSTDSAVKLLNNWRLSFEHFMKTEEDAGQTIFHAASLSLVYKSALTGRITLYSNCAFIFISWRVLMLSLISCLIHGCLFVCLVLERF